MISNLFVNVTFKKAFGRAKKYDILITYLSVFSKMAYLNLSLKGLWDRKKSRQCLMGYQIGKYDRRLEIKCTI